MEISLVYFQKYGEIKVNKMFNNILWKTTPYLKKYFKIIGLKNNYPYF